MSNVRRVYVEKKEAYAVKAKELQEEIKSYLGITSVTGVRVLIRAASCLRLRPCPLPSDCFLNLKNPFFMFSSPSRPSYPDSDIP